ncbi:hypothetical protein [Nocardia caishijiensis]|uniref:Uncharacterized protein n=1 Tax=Nocardia caishijiensis TaxID=184756 RepID=A0ABQ6YJ06_9NOCA|nr:hypothetical protein [Nocardia caishijiensis]KAF0845555.1 hypothetical protein FNL39_107156 [Nocardia caishijiensis]
MRAVYRVITAVAVAGAFASSSAAVASAEEPEAPKTPLVQYIESWPPAPENCDQVWDPIEDAVEDSVPPQYEAEFEAFDDWCEGDED